jgi:hypothetical protein
VRVGVGECDLEGPLTDLVEHYLARGAIGESRLEVEPALPVGVGDLLHEDDDLHRARVPGVLMIMAIRASLRRCLALTVSAQEPDPMLVPTN